MNCLIPICRHPTEDRFCRWHRKDAAKWREDDELGLLRLCLRCEDWWPADRDFFFAGVWYCRACVLEMNVERARRAA